MNKITIELLEKYKACATQREIFRATFPDGAALTEENVRIAVDAGLSVAWISQFIHASHRVEFEMRCKTLDDAYDAQRKTLDDAHDAKRKTLDDEYYAQRKPTADERTYKFGMLIIEFLGRLA